MHVRTSYVCWNPQFRYRNEWVRRSARSNETGLVVAVDRLSRSSILTVEPTEAVRASGAAQTVLPAASSQDPTGQPRSSLDAARLCDDIHINS